VASLDWLWVSDHDLIVLGEEFIAELHASEISYTDMASLTVPLIFLLPLKGLSRMTLTTNAIGDSI
jgi:hypothetical protein